MIHNILEDTQLTQPEAIAAIAEELVGCHQAQLLDDALLQILYDLVMRIPERADYPLLQAIAHRWSVL